MSALIDNDPIHDVDSLPHGSVPAAPSLSPNQRAWRRFKRNRLGYVSLIIFAVMLAVATFAELVANDRPLVARHEGQWFFPIVNNPPETAFGGDFLTETDWHDPFITDKFSRNGNFKLFTLIPYGASSVNYFDKTPAPAPPSSLNWLGTDEAGRDMVARLIYGFRISVWFGLALAALGVIIGIIMGAIQGYFAGRIDLTM
jgi:microcin C transport system permease protein